MKKQNKIIIFSLVCVILIITAFSPSFSPVSGYQSVTAEWNQVLWENAQGTSSTFIKPLEGTTFSWDADATGTETNGAIPDGMSNLPTITGQVENPKFDRNIDYHSWWVNDTVSAANPTGIASHYEWAIDIYTMNINFYAYQGTEYFSLSKPEVWVALQNNFDSVFKVLGAEDAASYVIYAQTENYTFVPADAGWHLIQPSVGNFELMFLSGMTITPEIPESGSDLDFTKLTPYSHIALAFVLEQFGQAWLGSAPTVNMIVELNVLTVGRFDYVLTYVKGGDNDIAPVGELGLFASMAAALGAGWSALMDGFAELGNALFGPLVTVAVVAICIVVIIIIWRRDKQ